MTLKDSELIMSGPSIPAAGPLSTDEQLVELVAMGDSAAIGGLYDRYVCSCFGLALRLLRNNTLAEAVVHDVFTNLWEQRTAYSHRDGLFSIWLLNMVHHKCIAELRCMLEAEAVSPTQLAPQCYVSTSDDGEAPGSGYAAILEQQKIISEALNQIAPEQREILELAYFEGLSHTQIAEKLSQPLSTVHTHARMGLRNLKALLEPTHLLV